MWTRLLRRTVRHIVRRTPICNGNYETWRLAFFDRDSMLFFHVRSFARKRARMRLWHESPDVPETVLLRSPAEVERWLGGIGPQGRSQLPEV